MAWSASTYDPPHDDTSTKPDHTMAVISPDMSAAAGDTDIFISAAIAIAAPALVNGNWINSEPLSMEKLRGKVVLLEFWTFGCYNCVNTLPAIKALDAKYRTDGLTIIGIETPELDYEKSFDNLVAAVKKRGIEYPVLTDYDYANWNKYKVEAWPTIFILDKQGRIRYEHIGEGAYDMQENVVKALLAEKAN